MFCRYQPREAAAPRSELYSLNEKAVTKSVALAEKQGKETKIGGIKENMGGGGWGLWNIRLSLESERGSPLFKINIQGVKTF
jgi:hypothetical protein